MTVITQTGEDLVSLQVSDREAYRDQLVAILGASKILTNQAEYPEDYDNTLAEGDDGYVIPVWVELYDDATLSRYGFQSREIVEARISEIGF